MIRCIVLCLTLLTICHCQQQTTTLLASDNVLHNLDQGTYSALGGTVVVYRWMFNGINYFFDSYLKFNNTMLPTWTISSVTLHLTNGNVVNNQPTGAVVGVEICNRIDWNESTFDFAHTSPCFVASDPTNTTPVLDDNLTITLFASQFQSRVGNSAFSLRIFSPALNFDTRIEFRDRSRSPPPRLVINYVAPAVPSPPTTSTPTTSPPVTTTSAPTTSAPTTTTPPVTTSVSPMPVPSPGPTPFPTPPSGGGTSTGGSPSDATLTAIDSDNTAGVNTPGNDTVLIGGVIGAILLAIAVCTVVIVVIIIRRRRERSSPSPARHNNKNDSVMDNQVALETVDPQQNTTDIGSQYHDVADSNSSVQQYADATAVFKSQSRSQSQLAYVGFDGAPSSSISAQYQQYAIISHSRLNEVMQRLVDPTHINFVTKLGEGNFGEVHLALYYDVPVAVKRLKDVVTADGAQSNALSEMAAEAKVLGGIPTHPNVLQLVAFCTSPVMLLTEFVDGGAMSDHIKTNQAPPTSHMCQWLLQVCAGLAHLHANNIIHRDLAARNILLRTRSTSTTQFECVIADMGMARLYNAADQYARTKTATLPLKWSPPELLLKKQYSVKSDTWSFGCVCIEVLSWNPDPYPRKSPVDVAMGIIAGRFWPQVPSNCPAPLQTVLESCFSGDPSNRPTAAELATTLRSL